MIAAKERGNIYHVITDNVVIKGYYYYFVYMTYVITVVYYLVCMLVENKPNQQKIDPIHLVHAIFFVVK